MSTTPWISNTPHARKDYLTLGKQKARMRSPLKILGFVIYEQYLGICLWKRRSAPLQLLGISAWALCWVSNGAWLGWHPAAIQFVSCSFELFKRSKRGLQDLEIKERSIDLNFHFHCFLSCVCIFFAELTLSLSRADNQLLFLVMEVRSNAAWRPHPTPAEQCWIWYSPSLFPEWHFLCRKCHFGRPSVKAAIFFPFTEANCQYSPFDTVGAQLGDKSRQIFCPLAAAIPLRGVSAICQRIVTSLPDMYLTKWP